MDRTSAATTARPSSLLPANSRKCQFLRAPSHGLRVRPKPPEFAAPDIGGAGPDSGREETRSRRSPTHPGCGAAWLACLT